jgi:hypothetical protein
MTIALSIEGLVYDLVIDTGSSELFIKGDGLKGQPPVKFSCDICSRTYRRYSISYLDGGIVSYLIEGKIMLTSNLYIRHQIAVAFYVTTSNF